MRNTAIISSVALAAMLLFSCQKSMKVVSEESHIRTFSCTIATENTDLKVAIDNTGKSTWVAGDKILIHGKYTAQDKVVTLADENISEDGKKATFSVDLSGVTEYSTDKYYAAYPADAYVDYDNEHGYYYNSFDKTNNILMSAFLSGDSFVFYNLCGVISFAVEGDFDSYVFTGNNGETVGYEKYQVKITSSDKNYKRTEEAPKDVLCTHGPLNSISGKPVYGDGTHLNYICLPNGANLTNGFTVRFIKDGMYVKKLSTKSSINVERGKVLPLGSITEHLFNDSGVVHTPASWTVGAKNLSEDNGSANCYIVDASDSGNKNKAFKIPAVKGNSVESVGAVRGVKVLWETRNTDSAPSVNSIISSLIDYDETNIYFQMPSTLTPGNALIAALDKNDDILWSWHIWVPENTICNIPNSTAFLDSSVEPAVQTIVMDRNLGALTVADPSGAVVTSYGLTYQWGRKDPFPGPKRIDSDDPAKLIGTAITVSSERLTDDTARKNPTMIGYETNQKDWLTPYNNSRWSASSKTQEDPCPPGYRVLPRNKNWGYMAEDLTKSDGWSLGTRAFEIGYPSVVFPLSGFRRYSSNSFSYCYSRPGTGVVVWTAYSSAEKYAYAVQYVHDDSDGIARRVEWGKATNGYVRCVAE